jgi:FixJ family two-component response regulator
MRLRPNVPKVRSSVRSWRGHSSGPCSARHSVSTCAELRSTAATCPTWVGVIDDDHSIRRALGRMLRLDDLQVECFETVEAYLLRAREDPPFCLVVDVHVGAYTLQELTAMLATAGPMPPTIFMTGDADVHDEYCATAADPFLLKPFDPNHLLGLVHGYAAAA